VWGYAMAHGDRSVDVFVRKLRQKLRSGSSDWNYIHTHFGVGYRFAPEREHSVEEELDLITSGHGGDELGTEELDSALAG
jgi:DNA-binding winged helix-turn-helix (wHTH) protein